MQKVDGMIGKALNISTQEDNSSQTNEKTESIAISELKTDLAGYYQAESSEIEVNEDELPVRDHARRTIESLYGRRIIGVKGEAYASAFNGLMLRSNQVRYIDKKFLGFSNNTMA